MRFLPPGSLLLRLETVNAAGALVDEKSTETIPSALNAVSTGPVVALMLGSATLHASSFALHEISVRRPVLRLLLGAERDPKFGFLLSVPLQKA
jgi:hypothetical protein